MCSKKTVRANRNDAEGLFEICTVKVEAIVAQGAKC